MRDMTRTDRHTDERGKGLQRAALSLSHGKTPESVASDTGSSGKVHAAETSAGARPASSRVLRAGSGGGRRIARALDWAGDHALQLALFGSIIVFVVYPLACILLWSGQGSDGFTLANYAKVWTDERAALGRSVFVGIFTSLLCTLISVAFSLFIATQRGWRRGLCMALLLLIMVSPPFVSSLAYIRLYGRRGWITYGLLHLNLNPYNRWGVILMQTVSFAPLNTLLLSGLLAKNDRSVIDAARDLGANTRHILTDVVLPSLKPGILVCLLLTFVRSLADYGTSAIIGGRYRTLATVIYIQYVGGGDMAKAAAMNMCLFIPSIVLFFVYRRQMGKMNTAGSSRDRVGRLDLRLTRGGVAGWLIIAISTIYGLVMVAQYTAIILSAITRTGSSPLVFTTQYIEQVFTYNASSLVRSVEYSLIVAVVGAFFAILFAYYVERRKVKLGALFDGLATLPYMIPGTCFGIGFILAFNHDPLRFTGTAFILIAVMLFRQLPTTTKLCSAAFAQISRAQEDSARDLGAGRLRVIRDIILPNIGPTFLTCFTYHFTSSMTSAGAILFLVAPKTLVAVFKLFDATYTGEYGVASVIAVLIILTVLVVEGITFLLTALVQRAAKRRYGATDPGSARGVLGI